MLQCVYTHFGWRCNLFGSTGKRNLCYGFWKENHIHETSVANRKRDIAEVDIKSVCVFICVIQSTSSRSLFRILYDVCCVFVYFAVGLEFNRSYHMHLNDSLGYATVWHVIAYVRTLFEVQLLSKVILYLPSLAGD